MAPGPPHPIRRTCGVSAVALIAAATLAPARAQEDAGLRERVRSATLHIEIRWVDPDDHGKSCSMSSVSTGFLISDQGHVLSADPELRETTDIAETCDARGFTERIIEARPGSPQAPAQDLMLLYSDGRLDVALLAYPDGVPLPSALEVCKPRSPSPGQDFLTAGFLGGKDFLQRDASYQSRDGLNWVLDKPFDPGIRGGAVVNAEGAAVAMIVGNEKDFPVRALPIYSVSALIERAGLPIDWCRPSTTPDDPPPAEAVEPEEDDGWPGTVMAQADQVPGDGMPGTMLANAEETPGDMPATPQLDLVLAEDAPALPPSLQVEAGDGGVAVGGDVAGTGNTVVGTQVIVGFSHEEVIELVLAIRTGDPGTRAEVLATLRADVPPDAAIHAEAVGRFLAVLGETDVPADELPDLLDAIAREYLAQQGRLAELERRTSAPVAREIAQARRAAADGDIALADANLRRAERLNQVAFRPLPAGIPDTNERSAPGEPSAQERSTSPRPLDAAAAREAAAALRAERGALALQRLDHEAAARLYAQAASMAPDPADRWTYEMRRAGALAARGRDFGATEALGAAVALYRDAALPLAPRDGRPLAWAATLNELGATLAVQGAARGDPAALREAVAAFEQALEERTRGTDPLAWAATQGNLGSALSAWGAIEGDDAQVERAVRAFDAALEELDRDEAPVLWARAQNNRGNALQQLGEAERGSARLEEALGAYRLALEVLDPEASPREWAAAQHNLGQTAMALDARAAGPGLATAVAAFEAALTRRPREHVPLEWAASQAALGEALLLSGERDEDVASVEGSVRALRAALQERSEARDPIAWAAVQTTLGNAHLLLSEVAQRPEALNDAAIAFGAALTVVDRSQTPAWWAFVHGHRGVARARLARSRDDAPGLDEARAEVSEAVAALRLGRHDALADVLEDALGP